MANIILDATKTTGVSSTFTLNPGDQIVLSGFELSQAQQVFVNELGQLVVVLSDGTQFLVSNFVDTLAASPEQIAIINEAGEKMSFADFIATYIDTAEEVEEIEPALGEETATTQTFATQAESEGSDAAENYDLYGASLGEGEVVTSEPIETSEINRTNFTTTYNTPLFVPNQAPNNNDGSVSGSEDSTFALNISAPNDVDSNNADLSITITSIPASSAGVVQLSGVNVTVGQVLTPTELANLTFTPIANYNGRVTLNYNVTDNQGATTASTHTINVTAVNDAPVFSGPSSDTVDEDSSANTINFDIPTDADIPYGDVVTINIDTDLSAINGTITLDGTAITNSQTFTTAEFARLQFTPNADYSGSFAIDYTATDTAGATASNTHTINVSGLNDAPVTTDSTSTQAEDSLIAALNITAPTDVDGDTLSITLDALPTEGTLYYADGTTVVGATDTLTVAQLTGLRFTPNANFNGDVTINYTVNDGTVTEAGQHTVTVTAVNDAPVATNTTSTQAEDSSAIALNITAPTDVDGDTLSITLDSLPTEGTVYYADGTTPVGATDTLTVAQLTSLVFTPNANYNGTAVLNYTVSDGTLNTSASHTVTVTAVNDAPVATDSTSTQNEDSTAISLNITAPTDVDNDTLSITLDSLPTDGTLYYADGITAVGATDTLTVAQLTGLRFTPNADFNGTVAINYTVSDGTTTETATHTITVNPEIPGSVSSASSQDEDTTATLGIPELGTGVTARVDTLPTEGTLNFANGNPVLAGVEFDITELDDITFTPNADYNGTSVVNYVITNADTSETAGSHTITVNPINDAPEATDSTSTQNEDSAAISLNITAPTDVDNDTLSITLDALPTDGTLYYADGITAVGATDTLTVAQLTGLRFTPNADFNGTVAINYTVSDGTTTENATHTITVDALNDAPVTTASTSTQDEDSSTVALNITAPTDTDGDALSITLDSLPTEGTVYYADGTTPVGATDTLTVAQLTGLRFTPNANYNGAVVINYTVSDGSLTTAGQHTVTVTALNDAPITTNSTSTQGEDSSAISLNITAPTDVDGDTLSITLDALPTEGTLYYADGTTAVGATDTLTVAQLTGLRFTPNADYNGDVTINYTVNDGTVTEAGQHTVTVTAVNDAPIATNSTSNQDEDTSATLNIPLPTDVDSSTLYATIPALPVNGTLNFASGNPVLAGVQFSASELATLTFIPDADFNGTVAINYVVEDDEGATDTATHTITVNAVNDAPVTTASTSTQAEDSSAVALNITAPTDVDGDTLTITLDALPTEGTLYYADGTTVVGAADTLTVTQLTGLRFTPNADFNGTVAINYTVNDGTVTEAGQHTVTVTGLNDAPVTTASTSTQAEDSSAVALNITAPTDADGDTLSITLNSLPTQGTLYYADGTTAVGASDTLTVAQLTGLRFTPNANYNGAVTINYTVNDGTTTSSGSHTANVTPVNDAPDATNSSSSQNENSSSVALNITAPTDIDGDTLTATINGLPSNGTLYYANGTTPVGASDTLTVAQLTSLRFTPNAEYFGTVDINYTVSDGSLTDTATHTITVNEAAANSAPSTTNSVSTQDEDSSARPLNIPTPTDADGDALTFTITSLPGNGTLTFNGGSSVQSGVAYSVSQLSALRFTPNPDYVGSTSLNYFVSDGTDTTSATHTIVVEAVNNDPNVFSTSSSQDADAGAVPLGITAPTDADGDTLTIRIPSLPSNGTLYYANGTLVNSSDTLTVSDLTGLRFAANSGYEGRVYINYTVSDGQATVNATHTVTITDSNTAPVAYNTSSSMNEDSANVSLNIRQPYDADGDTLTINITNLPNNGVLYYANGSRVSLSDNLTVSDLAGLRFTPDAGFTGSSQIRYIVSDGQDSASGSHSINVNAVQPPQPPQPPEPPVDDNEAPVAYNSSSRQDEGTYDYLNVRMPTDADGDILSVVINTLPSNGTLYLANGATVVTGIEYNASVLNGLRFLANEVNNSTTTYLNYTVKDPLGETANGRHAITINNLEPIEDNVIVSSTALVDSETNISFDSLLRAAERHDCLVNGTYKIDAEYKDALVAGGQQIYYDLPSNSFISSAGNALTYSGTYTYNGRTYPLGTSGTGIIVNPNTGDISGTVPSDMSGKVTINITATSSTGDSATKSLSYNVLSESDYNSIDVIGPAYGAYILPENTSHNLMVGYNDSSVLRYDLLSTGRGITADLDKGYVDKNNGYVDLIDNYGTIRGTTKDDTFIVDRIDKSIHAGDGIDTIEYKGTYSGATIDLRGPLPITGIEQFDAENNKAETIYFKVNEVLQQTSSAMKGNSNDFNYVGIKGDYNDKVKIADKTESQIESAYAGSVYENGVRYDAYEFNITNSKYADTLYVEQGLDILDMYGNVVD